MTTITLDPDNPEQMQALALAFLKAQNNHHPSVITIDSVVSGLTAAVRSLCPPAEPEGDALVRDRDGDVWEREDFGWIAVGDGTGFRIWSNLVRDFGPLKIYRPEVEE